MNELEERTSAVFQLSMTLEQTTHFAVLLSLSAAFERVTE
jgi:hypothetical protein